jgi:hypothetical protein
MQGPTSSLGTALAAAGRERARLIASRKVVPLPPSPLPGKLYAAIDGTGVPMTAKETAGREGKGEDGRARTREVKLAVFFVQDEVREYPLEGIKNDEAGEELGYFPATPPACATAGSAHAACSPDPASSRPAARPSSGRCCLRRVPWSRRPVRRSRRCGRFGQ